MLRHVEPELLDALPHDHVDARRSRRDLVRINALMNNWRWLARQLAVHARSGDRLVELGAGTGEFLRWWVRAYPQAADGIFVRGVDLAPRPEDWPSGWEWVQGDLMACNDLHTFDVVIANLVLHHFDPNALRTLGERLTPHPAQARGVLPAGVPRTAGRTHPTALAGGPRGDAAPAATFPFCGGEPGDRAPTDRPRVVLLCEPARRRVHVWQARALAWLGMNRVTRHDAPASVRAGFRDDELPAQLGLVPPRWNTITHMTWLGAYRVVAGRKSSHP